MADSIVEEELALLAQVSRALAADDERPTPSEENLIEELEHIRDQLVRGGPDFFDQSALATRWSVQSALLAQLRRSRSAPEVDPGSPYFAHLRLRESGRVRDVCLGRATRLDNGLRIVDWRHAPISQLFYRYQQGDEYEEEIGGRVTRGRGRRRAAPSRSATATLERIEAPEGIFDQDADRAGRLAARRPPRDRGSRAAKAPRCACTRRPTAGHAGSAPIPRAPPQRADKRLPDIAGLIDPEQFALIARPSSGFVVIRGTAGSGKTTVALHRIAYLAYDDPRDRLPAHAVRGVLAGAARLREPRAAGARRRAACAVRTFRDWAARAAPPALARAAGPRARRHARARAAPEAPSRARATRSRATSRAPRARPRARR